MAVTEDNRGKAAMAQGQMPAVVVIDKFPFSGTVYSQRALSRLAAHADVVATGIDAAQFRQQIERFGAVRAILSTWGMPPLDSELLDALPSLEAVFYAAGEHRALYLPAAAQRQITFCSSIGINSYYVALQTFASIILALKQALQLRDRLRLEKDWDLQLPSQGIYRKRIGLIAFGRVGRICADMLRPLPVEVFAWDPFVEDAQLTEQGVSPLSLPDIFSTCDVISVHLPLNPQTEGIIDRPLLERMKPGCTLINTARGSIIDEYALMQLLQVRPDITAVLDVCASEPPPPDHLLYQLPNCYLTPHISGAIGSEREHLGDCMVDEAVRWIHGQALEHQVSATAVT